jgi:hypothetical protein
MNAKLREFLDLVDCRPEEVKDVPKDRLLSIDELRAECAQPDPDSLRKSLAGMEIYFGKHKGSKLGDVPMSYLEWVLTVKPTNSSFRKFQSKVRQFLGRDQEKAVGAELRDPLTQELLAIVKNS